MVFFTWAPSSEFVSSSTPSWQILTAHAQPFRGARDLAFCLKVPLDSLLVWASSEGSGETARMRRLAWTFAARIGDKYQIRLTRSTYKYYTWRQSTWDLYRLNEQVSVNRVYYFLVKQKKKKKKQQKKKKNFVRIIYHWIWRTVNFHTNRFVRSWYGAIDCPSVSMQVSSHFFHEDVLREKQVFHNFLLNSYDCFWGQAKVSISVTLGYHCCQPHIAKPYQKTPLGFNYYCRQKTIFYHSIADFRVQKPTAPTEEHPS